MRLSFKSWKTKTAGAFVSATIILAFLPPSAVLFTVGTIAVTPVIVTGAIGALLTYWGISDKGDKIIKAITDAKNGGK